MLEYMNKLLERYTKAICHIYGSHIDTVLLYGSYARGDFRKDSDIDIMILVDLLDDETKEYGKALSDITFDFNLDFDLMIMPIVINVNHFKYWLSAYPFYKNVQEEGVRLYAGNPHTHIKTQEEAATPCDSLFFSSTSNARKFTPKAKTHIVFFPQIHYTKENQMQAMIV